MNEEIKNITIVGHKLAYARLILNKFNEEFNDYILKRYQNSTILKNGIVINIDSDNIMRQRYLNSACKYIRADSFIEECYKYQKNQYKKIIDEIKEDVKKLIPMYGYDVLVDVATLEKWLKKIEE